MLPLLHRVEILHFLQYMLSSECARLLLLNSQFIFYANGFQNTTNTGLLPFSAEKANVIISINRVHGSSFSDNASPHVNALNSDPTSCDLTAGVHAFETRLPPKQFGDSF